MPVTGLDHYNLSAHRGVLEVLRQFYVEVVGLRVGPRPAQRRFGHWLYAGEVAVLHLSEADADDLRALHAHGTFNHAAFRGQGFQSQQEILHRHGIAVRVVDVPQQRQLFFSDPAGNGVEMAYALDDNE